MIPTIKTLHEKKLIGQRLKMSFSEDKTYLLWSSFMPRRREILNSVREDLFSLQHYRPGYFESFDPQLEFEKWAAKEVTDFSEVPEGMETLILPGGLYAVFLYKGPVKEAQKIFRYILGSWLPASEYELDNRFHFEVLGPKYKNDSSDSEEEIWIPVLKRRAPRLRLPLPAGRLGDRGVRDVRC